MFKRLSDLAARPWFYGAVYLSLIPAFALIYQSIWRDFYQSTSKHERVTWALDLASRKNLADLIEPWLAAHRNENFRFRAIEVVGLSTTGSQVSFVSPVVYTLGPWPRNSEAEGRLMEGLLGREGVRVESTLLRGKSIRTVTFFPSWTLSLDTDDFTIDRMPNEILEGPREFRANGRVIGMVQNQTPAQFSSKLTGKLDVPDHVLSLLRQFGYASEGFPNPREGGFGRFFYFSTITITTLGFGDIVPMTDRARIIVSIEAILGVVAAGLFLNSIAKTASASRNQAPNSSGAADSWGRR